MWPSFSSWATSRRVCASVLRRASMTEPATDHVRVLSDGDLTVDTGSRVASRDGELLQLTVREFDLLAVLAAHPRQVFSREMLLNRVWGYDYVADPNLVEVHISALREKLGDKARQLIRTVRGVGYALRG